MKKLNILSELLRSAGRNPSVDWRLAIFCFAVLIIIFVMIHFYIYDNVLIQNKNADINSSLSSEFLNREDLNLIIKEIEDRRLDNASIPEEALKDPSI